MMKSRRKGFTLVELLVTIILLGIIGAIIIYNMTSVSHNTKESEYERFVAKVKSAASVYADSFPDVFNELYVNKAYIYITLGDLVSNGLLDEDLTNPFTSQKIGLEEIVKANLDSTNGALTFEYPLKEKQKETSLVAMSDYVVWGEPYDCMRGVGSYELSLADENGNLIDLNGTDENGVSNIKKYNFECKLPDEFESYNNPETGVKGLRTTKAGNYDVTYTWITESGTKKQATRTLRVLAKVNPTFRTNVNDYDFNVETDQDSAYVFRKCNNCDANNYYQTTLNSDGTWNYLTYESAIEGADVSTTKFKISKRSNNPASREWIDVTNGYVSEFAPHQADDGDKTYKIEAIINGHYEKNYSYNAEGYGRMKAELIVPESYISANDNAAWSLSKTYSINSDVEGHQSPVGIKQYEYRLSGNDSLDKNLSIVNENIFSKTAVITSKNISVINNSGVCSDTQYEYNNIYFRAINEEGYAGKWTKYNTHITNQITSILGSSSNGCVSSESCCLKNSTGCRFTNKVMYVNFANQNFVALEKFDNDKTILLAKDTDTNVRVSPLSVRNGYAEQQTCDGLFYKHYQYFVANDAILRETKRWADTTIGSSRHLVTPAVPGISSSTAYTLNMNLLNTYQNAVRADAGREYWLLDNGTSGFTVYLDQPHKHGNESTTAYNAYFYYASGTTAYQQYGGQSAFVKPLIRIKEPNICRGSGTRNDPYVIAK